MSVERSEREAHRQPDELRPEATRDSALEHRKVEDISEGIQSGTIGRGASAEDE